MVDVILQFGRVNDGVIKRSIGKVGWRRTSFRNWNITNTPCRPKGGNQFCQCSNTILKVVLGRAEGACGTCQ